MKVLFFTLGDQTVASSRTRVFQFLPHLKRHSVEFGLIQYKTGLDYRLLAKSSNSFIFNFILHFLLKLVSLFHVFYATLQTGRLLLKARSVDIVFVQKVLLPPFAQALLRRQNANIVFDYDDALYADEKAYSKSLLEGQLKRSKLAVLENENTETFTRQFNVPCLRVTGPIDCARYQPGHPKKTGTEVVLGWVGSRSTTPYLELAREALQELSKTHSGLVLELIGAGSFHIPGVRVRSFPWTLETEVELLKHFDIGLMPLPDNEFTRGKGGYKILQYMAIGIPCAASPVGVNSEILVDGQTGFLCQDTPAWTRALGELLKDVELRRRMGQNARQRAESKYSYEKYTPLLVKAFENVIAGSKEVEES